MEPFIDIVTVTGADDSIAPSDMVELTQEYPFVEWGILLSKSSEGNSRFPSLEWLESLATKYWSPDSNLKLSGHLCGSWVRDLCKGNWTVRDDRPFLFQDGTSAGYLPHGMFGRIQLNFHSLLHTIDEPVFFDALKAFNGHDYIFQLDDVNNDLLTKIERTEDVEVLACGLFDLSGGAGVLPEKWPTASRYIGYAGGLSPENLEEQLVKIEQVAPEVIWIDAETHLRSDSDQQFDLGKVAAFLEAAKPWVL